MTTRNQRLAENEILFRAANERMTAWGPPDAPHAAKLVFFCECARLQCRRHVALSRAEYEAVRADPRRFALVPGHHFPEAERAVEEHEDYVVVEKHDDVRPLVERTDPRRGTDA